MNYLDTIQLVKSLSGAEKRQFKLATKKNQRNKTYLVLFQLIDKSNDADSNAVKADFKKLFPGASLNTASTYLHRLLCEMLIGNQQPNNHSFRLYQGLMKIQVLKQRNLGAQAAKETHTLLSGVETNFDFLLKYLLKREMLNHYTANDFEGISEKKLIAEQQSARELLKDIRNVQEHYSLYEILKHRLIHSATKKSVNDQKKFDDLILSEMAVINNKTKHHLESQKLHLLFQSFYFTQINDHRSALKTFYLLNTLFEKNRSLLQHPPIDYFDTLNGILETLQKMANWTEMSYFIKKLQNLDKKNYPDYFQNLVRKTSLLYELEVLISLNDWKAALTHIEKNNQQSIREFPTVSRTIQTKLIYLSSVIYLQNKLYKKAIKALTPTAMGTRNNFDPLYYNLCACLNILLHYEAKDYDYIDYEIRSYKRAATKSPISNIEKLIFKVIKLHPAINKGYRNRQLAPKLLPLKTSILNNDAEKKLLHYFDFISWADEKFV